MLAVIIICLFLLCGCKQIEYIPVIEHHTDTTYITRWQKDSVWLHDSILIREKGDSFFIERWHTRYVEKLKTDTLYKATHDTIPQPYAVPAENTLWEKTKIRYGGWAMGIVAAAVVFVVMRIKKKLIGNIV